MSLLGKPVSRVDGPAKVRGTARYAAEVSEPGLLHGVVISSAVTKGRIERLDASAAQLPGVQLVLSHENRPHLPWFDKAYKDDDARSGSPFRALYDAKVRFAGQPVALVVADTLELARYAASLVKISYRAEEHDTDLHAQRGTTHPPKDSSDPPHARGDADRALARSPLRMHAEYASPAEHHNPMECHASTVLYGEDGALTIYDKTQGTQNSQRYVCSVFGMKPEQVRVLAPFVGGAFGSGLRPQYQLMLAVMAARELRRSVRVALTRQQMFSFGHRPQTIQRVSLGAGSDGRLTALVHEALAETSRFEDYSENVMNWSGMLYQCPDVKLSHEVADLDVFTPLDMRAPGAALGLFALESAMDELAHLAGIDPVRMRLINYTERDPRSDKPFSSKALRECYTQAAARFGWAERNPAPRSMQRDGQLLGWGMATGVWEAMSQATSARAVLGLDGVLTVSTAATDIGTGTYTILAQIAAETAGVPLEKVRVELGDSSLPTAPLQGGSWTAASAGAAVQQVCKRIRGELEKGRPTQELRFEVRSEPDKERQAPYSSATHSAVFAEVEVDPELGTLRVTRVVSAIAGGRILNPKTARSQIVGGVVWGISMATHEHTRMDSALGRYVNHDLAEYHIPVHADIHDIDVIFVDEQDDVVSPLGVKGLGEIGIVGVAAAVANAVFHATGKRIRELPITLDKLF